jgi:hypothetical protein
MCVLYVFNQFAISKRLVCYQSAISELLMLQTYIEFGRLRRRLGRQLNSSYELGLMPSYPLIIDAS